MRKQDLERAYKAFKGEKEENQEFDPTIIFVWCIAIWTVSFLGVLIYKSLESFGLL